MHHRLILSLLGLSVLVSGCATADRAAKSKWQTLFDGTSTEHWRAYKRDAFPDKGWRIDINALQAVAGGERVDIISKEQYQDFELELEWRVAPGANSGIFYGVQEGPGAVWHTGPEFQILDDGKHADGRNPKTSAGSLYALIAPNDEKQLRDVGEYNHSRIVVRGPRVEHWLNGAKVVSYEWGSPRVTELIAQSKFRSLPLFMKSQSGHIALQHHGDDVWFRKIRIRKL